MVALSSLIFAIVKGWPRWSSTRIGKRPSLWPTACAASMSSRCAARSARPAGAVNPNMASGAIEVLGYELEVLNQAETPPFPLDEYSDVGEETRLRYRFIDLRRPEMAAKLKLRSRITSSIRRYLDDN